LRAVVVAASAQLAYPAAGIRTVRSTPVPDGRWR
jgi:hypothetical protein